MLITQTFFYVLQKIQNEHLAKYEKLFSKNVKLKKRHEILNFSKVCSEYAERLNVKYIVDFGSGMGHLARTLTYGYGLRVCCIEMQETLIETAR